MSEKKRKVNAVVITTSLALLVMTIICIAIKNSMFVDIDLHRVFPFF